MIDKVISSVPPPTAAKRAAAEDARRRLELRRAAAAGRYFAPGGGEDRRPITERILDAQPCVSDAGRRGRQFGSFLLPGRGDAPRRGGPRCPAAGDTC